MQPKIPRRSPVDQLLTVSERIGLEALVRILLRKGLLAEEELLDELRAVQSERETAEPRLSEFEKGF